MDNIEARTLELIEAPWQSVKAAAEAVGLKKGDGTWNDMADEIAKAEAEAESTLIPPGNQSMLLPKVEELPNTNTAAVPDYTQSFLYKAGVDMCLNCGEKRAKHADGSDVICCDNPKWRY